MPPKSGIQTTSTFMSSKVDVQGLNGGCLRQRQDDVDPAHFQARDRSREFLPTCGPAVAKCSWGRAMVCSVVAINPSSGYAVGLDRFFGQPSWAVGRGTE